MTTYPNARRGDIWFVTNDALGGCSESDRTIRGARPVLVISSDGHNFTSPCLTVVPISSGPHRLDGTDSSNVILHSACLERQSAAVVGQITTIDRDHLLRFIGVINALDLLNVATAVHCYLELFKED